MVLAVELHSRQDDRLRVSRPTRSGQAPRGALGNFQVKTPGGARTTSWRSALESRSATRVIVDVPVSSREAFARLSTPAKEVISLLVPSHFLAVGEWYEDFSQTTDDEVTLLLEQSSGQNLT